jgi:peptide/nickel transport system substrate-binding protein
MMATTTVAAGCATAPAPAPTAAPAKAPEPTKAPAPQPTAVPPTAAPAAKAAEPTKAPAAAPTAAPAAGKYKEAPMLADLVKAGKLPPVDQRLPVVPKIANEMPAAQLKAEIGQYGGSIRTLTPSVGQDTDVFVLCNEPLINTPGIVGEEVTPNIVEAYEVSPDQKTFTFKLRKGLKWSDGAPVSTEDVRYAFEDVLNNTELTKSFPTWLRTASKFDGAPAKATIVDDITFKLDFAEPYGGFLLVLAIQSWRNYMEFLKPSHYLKKFHKKYAKPEELDAAMKEANVTDWLKLYTLKDMNSFISGGMTAQRTLGLPSLQPWVIKTVTPQLVTFERNPYYFKVDAAGNQLPYVDTLQSYYVADVEVIDLKNMAGECDYARSNPKLIKLPLYKENEAKGGYKMRLGRLHATVIDVFLNLTFKDEVWRKVVWDKRFRQALNMAIDRAEIIDTVWYGYAKPSTIIPGKLDIAGANKLLDEMGLDKKDADGFRLGPDGKTFVVPFETGAQRADQIPTLELLVAFWKKIGIKTTLKKIDGSLWAQRTAAGEHQATIYWSHTPLWYMGDLGQSMWATLWQQWWTSGGKQGEEPPADVKSFFTKVSQISAAPPEQGRKVYDEVRQMMNDNVYYLVPVESMMQPILANAKLANVSDSEDAFAIGSNFSGEQFFYKK